jgi:hypothetical protein
LGGNLNPLRVYDVIWEGTTDPTVTVYVHRTKVEHNVRHDPMHNGRPAELAR